MALNANTQYFFCASKYMGGLILQLLALTFVHLHNNQSINQFALSCLTDGSEFPEVCEVLSGDSGESHLYLRRCSKVTVRVLSSALPSFTHWPLLAGHWSALSAARAVQYIIYGSCFLWQWRWEENHQRGRGISVPFGAVWPGSFFSPLSEFPSEEIETGHQGETVAIRSEIAKCPPQCAADWNPRDTRWGGSAMIAAVGII